MSDAVAMTTTPRPKSEKLLFIFALFSILHTKTFSKQTAPNFLFLDIYELLMLHETSTKRILNLKMK